MINVDKEEDSDDVMFIDEKVHKSKKGKEKQDVSDGYGGHQAKVCDIKYVLVADSKFI